MNRSELEIKLNLMGIKKEEYSLYGELNPDSVVLYTNYTKWEIFYLDERGGRDMLQILTSEEEACNFLYKYFSKRVERKKGLG